MPRAGPTGPCSSPCPEPTLKTFITAWARLRSQSPAVSFLAAVSFPTKHQLCCDHPAQGSARLKVLCGGGGAGSHLPRNVPTRERERGGGRRGGRAGRVQEVRPAPAPHFKQLLVRASCEGVLKVEKIGPVLGGLPRGYSAALSLSEVQDHLRLCIWDCPGPGSGGGLGLVVSVVMPCFHLQLGSRAPRPGQVL